MSDLTGQIDFKIKDLPKVDGAPKPSLPLVFTLYFHHENRVLMARVHPSGKFNFPIMEGIVDNPENLYEVLMDWMTQK